MRGKTAESEQQQGQIARASGFRHGDLVARTADNKGKPASKKKLGDGFAPSL